MARVWITIVVLSLVVLNGAGYSKPQDSPISGTVTDEEGNPIAGVQVQIFSILPPSGSMHAAADTSSSGTFRSRTWEGADVTVVVNIPGKVAAYDIVKSPAEGIELVVKEDGRKLSGTVVNSEDEPVPNARVALIPCAATSNGCRRIRLSSYGVLYVTADDAGRFSVEDLPSLPVIIWSVPPEKEKSLFDLWRLSPKEPAVDLTNGDDLDIRVVLDETQNSDKAQKQNAQIEEHRRAIEKQLEELQH